jgi:hypothetical protein
MHAPNRASSKPSANERKTKKDVRSSFSYRAHKESSLRPNLRKAESAQRRRHLSQAHATSVLSPTRRGILMTSSCASCVWATGRFIAANGACLHRPKTVRCGTGPRMQAGMAGRSLVSAMICLMSNHQSHWPDRDASRPTGAVMCR